MTQADDSLLMPLLFYRPHCATVPIMRLSLVGSGDGAPHQSIRKPLEVLNQTCAPANVSILAEVLPQYQNLSFYTASFLFPPRGVNQFVDDFPDGMSHLAAVLLAFYALGADAALRGHGFRQSLAGWTASTYPDKGGLLKPAAHLREKLAAVFEENAELERLGCRPVAKVLLSADDRVAIAEMLGVPVSEVGDSVPLAQRHVAPSGRPAHAADAAGPPPLTLYFARDFPTALRLVFGAENVRKYRQRLVMRTLLGRRTWGGAALAAALLAVVWLAVPWRGPLHRAEIVAETGIQAVDSANRTLWRREFGSRVSIVQMARDSAGQVRVIAGMQDTGPAAGNLVVFDHAGRELWRFQTGGPCPYESNVQVNMAITGLLVSDVLPERGDEVILTTCSQWAPGRAIILSEDGKLLRAMWHPGGLSGAVRIGQTDRLVFWGCNNALRRMKFNDGSGRLHYALFCVRAADVAGQCPPYKAPGVPRAAVLWYKVLRPQGMDYERVTTQVNLAPEGTRVEAWARPGWAFYLDADGNVIGRERGDDAQDPPPELVDVLAALGDG
ncbi:MAG TPA: hypothetical protein PLE19_19835 [Planctomycetota bacterium]|nr:hypothetical protein [Planctomycetota bacterium]HRR80421.1 hypothetical protein [Planctomycetota bacterium]HRT94111.1 hypothetical protein [Planctomycetota bacterium]